MMVFGELIEIRGTMQCSKKPLITNVLFATIYSPRFNRDDFGNVCPPFDTTISSWQRRGSVAYLDIVTAKSCCIIMNGARVGLG